MKRFLIFFAAFCLSLSVYAQEGPVDSAAFRPDESIAFAQYDTLALEMDLYFPKDDAESHPCIIYSYGGGFVQDNQRHFDTRRLCRKLADDGFVVIAANYRLGLKGVQFKGVAGMVKPLDNAIQLATEDVMKVTRYVVDYASELTVDPSKIILVGSSAGAIASLQCDYERCNRTALAQKYLPEGFRYAGVAAFSGAVFSRNGLEYDYDSPAPTLFLHGTADRLVTYKQIKLFSIGFYGSDKIAKEFKEEHFPYKIIRFTDEGHTVAARYFTHYDDLLWFIENMVLEPNHYEIDQTFYEPFRKKSSWDTADPGSLYK
ncbi:MAG: carboxylesterase family protein [Bacteroidales bacterium]|nr:carboxylesterase family protein [Bacteroidales bacterium]